MRQHGSASDNLLSAEVVVADGQMLRVIANENRGLVLGNPGGGNFGIVTSFEYGLHRLRPVRARVLHYPMSHARGTLPTHQSVYAADHESLRHLRREQEVVVSAYTNAAWLGSSFSRATLNAAEGSYRLL
jgi:FAD/FMN-containing dehydrogenase